MDFILTLLSIISFWEVGYLTNFYFLHKKQINLSSFFGLGLGIVGLMQILLGLAQIKLQQSLVLTFFILTTLWVLLLYKKKQKKIKLTLKLDAKKLIPILSLAVFILFISYLSLLSNVWGYDAYSIWLARARAFWLDGSVSRFNLYFFWPFDHPILWPLSISWIYFFLGKANEYYSQVLVLSIWIAIILIFLQQIKLKKIHSILWFSILLTTPFLYGNVIWNEYVGNADLLASFFLLLAISQIIKKNFLHSVLFLFFTTISKNDLLPASLLFLVLTPLVYRKDFFQEKITAWLALLLFIIGNFTWKAYYQFDNRYINNALHLELLNRDLKDSLIYSLHAFREEWRQLYRWGLGWWLILYGFIIGFKEILSSKEYRLCFLILLGQLISYLIVYYLTPEDQATNISTSIYRLSLQIYPSVLYLGYKLIETKK
ncbi:hypothetical protein GYA49_03395 [Candidatus Beckwithbacteria bacterium]|nr:hypothetical protein [Candidatus Beckwithbacteria bacterium]